MIDFINSPSGQPTFAIGDVRIHVSPEEASRLGELLRHESIERIADSSDVIRVGEWSLCCALDEDKERERDLTYRRILLGHGERSWHLSREEAVTLGSRFRTESAGK